MPWWFPQAACSFSSSCPSRAGRYGSPRSSLGGQVWTPAAALPRDPCPEGLGCPGVIIPSNPEAEHTPPTKHQAAGSLAAKLTVLVLQCHKPHCIWGCMLGVLSKETPRANAQEELPGWILIRNKFGVTLLSLKPAPVCMHRKGPAGVLQNL